MCDRAVGETAEVKERVPGMINHGDAAEIEPHSWRGPFGRRIAHGKERRIRQRRAAGRRKIDRKRRGFRRQLRRHFGDEIEHAIGPVGRGGGQQNFEPLRKLRREVGEVMRGRAGVGQDQRRRAENLRRIALRLEAAIALCAVALNKHANIGNGADEAVRQKEIEMGRFAGRANRAAEQSFVDEGADNSLLAGAVRRHHDVQQKSRRAGSGGQPPHVDSRGQVGAAEHFGFRGRHAQLIETDAIGRQR